MQITIPYSFHVGVLREKKREKKTSFIQWDPNPRCSSEATSFSEPGQSEKIPGLYPGNEQRNRKIV